MTHKCACSPACESRTDRTFASGHDMRMIHYLVGEVERGRMSPAEAQVEAMARGASLPLMIKVNKAVHRKNPMANS